MGLTLSSLENLINTVAILALFSVVIYGAKSFDKFTKNKKIRILIGSLVGGLFGIYAQHNGVNFVDSTVTVRDVGPMIAGVLGGPICGLFAGLIAGIYRFYVGFSSILDSSIFPIGGTTILCSFATVFIGILSGVFRDRVNKDTKNRKWYALILVILLELFHLFVVFVFYIITTKDFGFSFKYILDIAPSFLLSNAIAMFIIILIFDMLNKYKNAEVKEVVNETELSTAAKIQTSMLPQNIGDLGETFRFSLFADMCPSKKVGGDFYDFFYVDKNNLCIIVGDTSDKGVGSALFSVKVKQMLKDYINIESSLDSAITKVNKELIKDNFQLMFVTLFAGIINLQTGKLTYINAGHCPPIYYDGELKTLDKLSGPALGVVEANYISFYEKLSVNSNLVIYTDGVTDAVNKDNEQYGIDRFKKYVRANKNSTSKTFVKKALDEIKEFGPEQVDDVTILELRYKGRK